MMERKGGGGGAEKRTMEEKWMREERKGGGGGGEKRKRGRVEEEETMTRMIDERVRGEESRKWRALKGFCGLKDWEPPPDPRGGPTTQMLERACSSALTR